MTNAASAQSKLLEPVSLASLSGWKDDFHEQALAAFRRSCDQILSGGLAFSRPVTFAGRREDWLTACQKSAEARDARRFFEEEFVAFAVKDPIRPEGLFTGYYEPEVLGSPMPAAGFGVPLYATPKDLVVLSEDGQHAAGLKYGRNVNGQPAPYFSRKEIEQGALSGRGLEIVWLRDPVDAFFMHIQGSGRVRFPDGRSIRLAFAAKSGRPYTSLGRLLIDRGVLSEDNMSMQMLRRWMADHPKEAQELMWENQSFVFFREVTDADSGLGVPGAQKIPLTPQRSLAVDRKHWMFGTPVWIETLAPTGPGAALEDFRRLLIAQDTGTAIRGYARGDIYWGWGAHAEQAAGHMKSPGRMIVLLPGDVAVRVLEQP